MARADLIPHRNDLTTRRAVVKAGAKVAYAAPLVAASFKLTGRHVSAIDYCEECFDDALSPKRLDGEGCYSCKVVESGCVASQSNVQAADLTPNAAGGLYCKCQGNTCIINGIVFKKGDNVTLGTNGACAPVVITGTRHDTCGVAGVSAPV